eukprot:770869-Amphidinium_carterae.1
MHFAALAHTALMPPTSPLPRAARAPTLQFAEGWIFNKHTGAAMPTTTQNTRLEGVVGSVTELPY